MKTATKIVLEIVGIIFNVFFLIVSVIVIYNAAIRGFDFGQTYPLFPPDEQEVSAEL